MLTIALAALVLGFPGPQSPLCCPVTLEEVTGTPAITMEYGGALFGTCCGSCDAPFKADPKGLIGKAIEAHKTVGAFEYDPVSGLRIDSNKAVDFSDYKAIRYYFATAAEKKSFDAKPAKYVSDVKSEAYFCPIMKMALDSKDVGGFADYNGVRYFLCCDNCTAKFRKNPAAYVAKAKEAVRPLAVATVKG